MKKQITLATLTLFTTASLATTILTPATALVEKSGQPTTTGSSGYQKMLPLGEISATAPNTFGTPGAWRCGKDLGQTWTAPKGTRIISVAPGKVTSAAKQGAYGNSVTVKTKDPKYGTVIVRYFHMQKIMVRPGQKVKTGSRIGTVGQTGRTYGPNLRIQINKGPKTLNACKGFIDPLKWLTS